MSLLRRILGKVILVISGRGRMMYQCLEPKPEGTILSKRSKPQGTDSSPHDARASIANWLKSNIQGNEARRDGRQGVAAPHSSVEAGERPFRTPWSEGGAALWTGSWNHAEDTVPHQRVTAKQPSRVRDSDLHNVTNRMHLTCTSGSVGAPGSNLACWPAPQKLVQPKWESPGRLSHGGTHEQAKDRPGGRATRAKQTAIWPRD